MLGLRWMIEFVVGHVPEQWILSAADSPARLSIRLSGAVCPGEAGCAGPGGAAFTAGMVPGEYTAAAHLRSAVARRSGGAGTVRSRGRRGEE